MVTRPASTPPMSCSATRSSPPPTSPKPPGRSLPVRLRLRGRAPQAGRRRSGRERLRPAPGRRRSQCLPPFPRSSGRRPTTPCACWCWPGTSGSCPTASPSTSSRSAPIPLAWEGAIGRCGGRPAGTGGAGDPPRDARPRRGNSRPAMSPRCRRWPASPAPSGVGDRLKRRDWSLVAAVVVGLTLIGGSAADADTPSSAGSEPPSWLGASRSSASPAWSPTAAHRRRWSPSGVAFGGFALAGRLMPAHDSLAGALGDPSCWPPWATPPRGSGSTVPPSSGGRSPP